MRSCRLTILACALGFLACAACNPNHTLLRSKLEPDAGPAPPAPPAPVCFDSKECAPDAACYQGRCATCSEVLEKTCDCPDGTTVTKVQLGECTACECHPACDFHSDCPRGQACSSGACIQCVEALPCPPSCHWGWKPTQLVRNDCTVCECVPPQGCVSDVECGDGMRCYPGLECEDDCAEPRCCYGNLCARAGCKPPSEVDCVYVGCGDGVCGGGDPGCPLTSCTCTPGALPEWFCPNTCLASCHNN